MPAAAGRLALHLVVMVIGLAAWPASSSAQVRPSQPPPPAPQIPRDAWKDCAYNGETIGCIDAQLAEGFRVAWKDGLRMTYTRLPRRNPTEPQHYRDRLGGIWSEEIFQQGNKELTNVSTGNRIFIPLRFPCKPPLKGEVGYCHH